MTIAPQHEIVHPPSKVTTAALAELPEFLSTPPWERGAAVPRPALVRNVAEPQPLALRWLPGEQARWANLPASTWPPVKDWAVEVERHLTLEYLRHSTAKVFALAPVELVAPHLDVLRASFRTSRQDVLCRLFGRFGDEVLDAAVAAAVEFPRSNAGALLPVTGTTVTTFMTKEYHTARGRAVAVSWFDRHLAAAAPDLIATAVGKPGRDRVRAWTILRAYAAQGRSDELHTAAEGLGAKAAAAFATELAADPLFHLPGEIPSLPSWLTVATLPPIVLSERRSALPPEALATVCVMLALCTPDAEYAGITRLTGIAEPESLTAFAWALFEQWERAGCPVQQNWVFHALGRWGDDEVARRLAPRIRAWPGESAHARAATALSVLTAIGSGVALRELDAIATDVKFKALRAKARDTLTRLVDEEGVDADELADRLVPHFGFAADGTLHLDYGPRAFHVTLDEQLRPVVRTAGGSPRRTLPTPDAHDDPVLAPASSKRFTALRKALKTTGPETLSRLERAMTDGRRWTQDLHHELFVDHPVLAHVARRLVWATYDTRNAALESFRITEDGSLTDLDDAPLVPTPGALVGVAHPTHLAESLPAWRKLFSHHALEQPFPQLHRPPELSVDTGY